MRICVNIFLENIREFLSTFNLVRILLFTSPPRRTPTWRPTEPFRFRKLWRIRPTDSDWRIALDPFYCWNQVPTYQLSRREAVLTNSNRFITIRGEGEGVNSKLLMRSGKVFSINMCDVISVAVLPSIHLFMLQFALCTTFRHFLLRLGCKQVYECLLARLLDRHPLIKAENASNVLCPELSLRMR